jgi:uncharacterized protein
MTPGIVQFANGAAVRVEIVETPEEMARGLMGRTSLPWDEGMLFWFGARSDHAFWMRNTGIPLDLIFVAGNHVVGVITLYPFDENLRSVGRQSDFVIETNGGWATKNGVCAGAEVLEVATLL